VKKKKNIKKNKKEKKKSSASHNHCLTTNKPNSERLRAYRTRILNQVVGGCGAESNGGRRICE
ncbi:MAG: hypothetical protein ABW149_10395, partial [Sedimenticola sp.]